jgi:hypothetical protein
MSAQRAISKAISTHDLPTTTSGTWLHAALHRALPVVRVVWLAWTLVLLSFFAYSVPLRYSEVVNSVHFQAGLQQIGFTSEFYAAYSVGLEVLFALVFCSVGAIIYLRRSTDWVSLYVSFSLVTFGVGAAPLLHVLSALTRKDPVWTMPQTFLAFLAWSLLHIFTYIFPDGRFLPRWTVWVAIGTEALLAPWFLLPVDSPFSPWTWHPALLVLLILAIGLCPAITQLYRYIVCTGKEYRQQIKWVVFGLTTAALSSVAALLPLIDPSLKPAVTGTALRVEPSTMLILYQMIGTTIFCIAAMCLPIMIAFSIFRYRLWAIDVLINRTLVYIPLTGILTGAYAASITLFQRLFVAFTGDTSDGAIVISTLILASMFTPAKNTLQSVVDARFKEAPDPTRKLKAFGNHVHSVVEVMDPKLVTSKMLDEVVSAFGAQGGGVYLGGDGYMRLEHTSEDWDGEATLTVPLKHNGKRLGLLALGPRASGVDYTKKDREALQETAGAVAELLSLQGVSGATNTETR